MPRIHSIYSTPDARTILGSCTRLANVTRTWVENDVGTASFELPFGTPDIERVAAYGALHWIYEDGLRPWVGYVETRSYTDISLKLELRSAEGLLKGQTTRQGIVLGADGPASRAAIAYAVFSSAIGSSTVPLRSGLFDAGGAGFVTYDYVDCFDTFRKLADGGRASFWVDEQLRTNFRSQRGIDKRNSIYLRQGNHLIDVQVTETIAESINAAVGLGAGTDIVSRDKKALVMDPIGPFRSEVFNYNEAADAEMVASLLTEDLQRRQQPRITVEGTLLKGAMWGQFWLGDYVTVITYPPSQTSWRREHVCRVTGAEAGQDDKLRLVLEAVADTSTQTPRTWVLT